jgi:tetratricopeptide (TPR) repeat protein
LPRAIELAAARIKLLSSQALLARLESRLELLTGGARDMPARQQTLRATIDWSYDLLDEGEKRRFARLAVFVGGWTLEAADAVINPEGSLDISVLDGLGSLVDKSLVRLGEEIQAERRFGMLETIREYALERLEESGEAETLRRTHASYFLRWVEQAEPHLKGPQQAEWLARLEEEHDNFRAALAWCRNSGETETGLRLGGALWRLWYYHGYFSEGRSWLKGLLSESGRVPATVRAKALHGAGVLAESQGDYGGAGALCGEALALYRDLGHKQGVAASLNTLATVALEQGDYGQATGLFEESLAMYRELEDKWGIALDLNGLGVTAWYQNDYERATPLFEESLAMYREQGDKQYFANALSNLGAMAWFQGNYERTRALTQESLTIFRQVGDRSNIADSLEILAWVACIQGQLERAARIFGAEKVLREVIGAARHALFQLESERRLAATRAGLGEVAFTAAWAEGGAMPLEQAIAYALEETSPDQDATYA